jgi:hypothetical protein
MSEGWVITPWMGCVFFRYCRRYNIPKDVNVRAALMRRICAKGNAKYIRDVDPYLTGKKVIQIRPKKEI